LPRRLARGECRGSESRERAVVTLAGVAPDVDGLGLIAEVLTRHAAHPLNWWSDYHHVFGHNLTFGVLVMALAFGLAQQRWKVAALVFVSFHLHLLCDLVGARGPDGTLWTIPYLWPFTLAGTWEWAGQWLLNSWQNLLLTAALLAATLFLAWKRGYSPLELVSAKADAIFVETLRRRFPPRLTGS